MSRRYASREAAARAFVRAGRKAGTVRVLGGGWWELAEWRATYSDGSRRPKRLQGLAVLAAWLERAGRLHRGLPVPYAGPQPWAREWQWELRLPPAGGGR